MPMYDYVCDSCEHTLEFFQAFKEAPKKKCPQCNKLSLRRVISGGIGLVFKGSGFYVTDNRGNASASNNNATEQSSTSSTTKTDEKTRDISSEKKPSTTDGAASSTAKPAKAA